MKSFLFVPSKAKMLLKIPTFSADAYIIDLEDSIKESDKEVALDDLCSFLKENTLNNIFIRLDGNLIESELSKLSSFNVFGFMIPKFEKPSNYNAFSHMLKGKKIIALVETPLGLTNIEEIAKSPMVDAIAFGAEDFSSSIGMKNLPTTLSFAKSMIVTYGKAYSKPVIDTPSFIIDNPNELTKEIQESVDMGFDGKLAIHPNQIELINSLFHLFDLDYMKRVIDVYEKTGEAVVVIDGHVYEKMHIAHFKRIIKEHKE